MRSFIPLAALVGLASAHFQLKYPPTIGFEDSKEDTAPCGGFTPDLTKSDLPDFHIGGDAVAVRLSHPQSKWLFRVTTGDVTDDKSWEQIYPIVLQSGLGDFCLPALTVPSKYEGKKGVLSIVSSAVDGLLFQCSAVNFVSGSQKAPSQCTNATLTASFSSDSALSALVGSGGSNATATSGSGSSTSTSATASPSATKNAAAAVQAGSGVLAVLGGLLLL
ncbi:expression library immunization antigen 1 [Cordyceps fumosorosea ARSEF 2679]|uniref:Expression library immunization antigen 1 n=1 Tax=Cordyceps fumosorosea (strain ARSEF 2679) TaxID=1081104 RepID=A0A167LYS3_CORFA|nr:expression library immunization antigen 1 [Cordyceps fumosorosea ARSEF 2679]OAA53701.1 expression library immunization antigen 1 [Cordyceps fumosorosea ARSEF 2679]